MNTKELIQHIVSEIKEFKNYEFVKGISPGRVLVKARVIHNTITNNSTDSFKASSEGMKALKKLDGMINLYYDGRQKGFLKTEEEFEIYKEGIIVELYQISAALDANS